MPAVGRVGIDAAGGIITEALAPNITVNGAPVICVGAAVAPHGNGPHANATMVEGSGKTTAGGIQICRVGDAASCGHTLTSGSDNVTSG